MAASAASRTDLTNGGMLLRASTMSARGEARVFYGGIAVGWVLFVTLAYLSPVQLDDWYQLTWHRHHPFGCSLDLADTRTTTTSTSIRGSATCCC